MLTIKQSQFEHVEVFVQDVFKEQAETYFDELRDKEEERLTLAAYEGEHLAGAVVAKRQYDHIYIEFITVDSAFQGRKIGSKLMNAIENLSKERNIINITLRTRSYQAAGFYKKCGYTCYATLDDMPMRGISMHYFVKRLN